jgi:hypothetical protein
VGADDHDDPEQREHTDPDAGDQQPARHHGRREHLVTPRQADVHAEAEQPQAEGEHKSTESSPAADDQADTRQQSAQERQPERTSDGPGAGASGSRGATLCPGRA